MLTATNLTIGQWDEIGKDPHEFLCTLAGSHDKGTNRITFLAVDGDGLVPHFHPLFCVVGGKYEEGLGNLWEVKGGILDDGLLTLVKLTPPHLALNLSFRGSDRVEFDMHVNSLSSTHPQEFDATSHQVAAVEDEGLRIVRYRGLTFVPADILQAVLEVILDGITTPISEVVCRSYGLLTRSASRAFDCSSDWIQESFTACESSAYLEGTIRTRRETPALTTLPGSFQGRLAIANLQHKFPGHFLTDLAASPATTGKAPFKLTCLPLRALCPTLARLRGGTGRNPGKGVGGGEGRLRMRSHCALRVAISRDALDRVGRRLANGRSELDAEHLHAAWRAWKRAASSKVGV